MEDLFLNPDSAQAEAEEMDEAAMFDSMPYASYI
jgi:hypothetical protein